MGGGSHDDTAQCKSHVLVVRWMVKREGEAAQLGLFKREMDRGSEQGTNIPLQRAHDSASICTPLSLPPIHHSLAAPTSCFHLTPRYPRPFLPNLSRAEVRMGFSSFLNTQDVIHLGWRFIFRCICGEHMGRGVCAETRLAVGGCVGRRQLAIHCGLYGVCLQQAWLEL